MESEEASDPPFIIEQHTKVIRLHLAAVLWYVNAGLAFFMENSGHLYFWRLWGIIALIASFNFGVAWGREGAQLAHFKRLNVFVDKIAKQAIKELEGQIERVAKSIWKAAMEADFKNTKRKFDHDA